MTWYNVTLREVGSSTAFYQTECGEGEISSLCKYAQELSIKDKVEVLLEIKPREKFFRFSPNPKFSDKPETAYGGRTDAGNGQSAMPPPRQEDSPSCNLTS